MTSHVFAHGHLRLYLLGLLQKTPMHGYELILALHERFGGTYTPSAGTIYPRLAKLEDDGLVSKSTEGRKTVYAITDAGRAEVAGRQDELAEIESDVTDSVRRMADEVRFSVDQAMKNLRLDLATAAQAKRGERSVRQDIPLSPNTVQLREAELVLDRFRHQVRVDLRGFAARGEIPSDTARLLKVQLDQARSSILEILR